MVQSVVWVNRVKSFSVHKENIQVIFFIVYLLRPNPKAFGASIYWRRYFEAIWALQFENFVHQKRFSRAVLSDYGTNSDSSVNIFEEFNSFGNDFKAMVFGDSNELERLSIFAVEMNDRDIIREIIFIIVVILFVWVSSVHSKNYFFIWFKKM